jgi:hypothetical protein
MMKWCELELASAVFQLHRRVKADDERRRRPSTALSSGSADSRPFMRSNWPERSALFKDDPGIFPKYSCDTEDLGNEPVTEE